jgi:hypothetical protein
VDKNGGKFSCIRNTGNKGQLDGRRFYLLKVKYVLTAGIFPENKDWR